ncbi:MULTISPECIES: hypothetical protein [unclassified Agrococcus]|uniref:hypothetical protein n=1 Tax=unclassified Agrococcus TaxID=2615065 RepID=UPI00361E5EAC
MSGPAGLRRLVTRRSVVAALAVAVLAAATVGVEALVPGQTARWAPFSTSGSGVVTSGPLTVEVHGATLAAAIELDGEIRATTGVFVVVDATIATTGVEAFVARDLRIDGRVYDASAKGPTSVEESEPAAGFPVRGDLVFEVDDALLEDGGVADLVLAPGRDAEGDLQTQVVVRFEVGATVEPMLEVTAAQR